MKEAPGFARAVAAARNTAATNRHAFVGTEHLLAGLLDDPAGLAATLFSRAGIDPGRARTELLKGLRRATGDPADPDALPLSRLAQQALDGAARGAQGEGRQDLYDRDLLRALLRSPKGRVAQVLASGGAAVDTIRQALDTSDSGRSPSGSVAVGRRDAPDRTRELRRPAAERAPERGVAPRGTPPRASAAVPARAGPPRWMFLLLLAVPASIGLSIADAPAVAVFVATCLAVLPLAGLMGEATEALAERTGPTVGGLLNATFGNAAELIIALVALRSGLVDLVKASITGSILGNLLLILGLSCIAAGTGRATVRFSRTNAGMSAAMLALAVIGLVFPALFHATHPAGPEAAAQAAELYQSEIVAGILIVTYGLSLLFTLKTHRTLFGGGHGDAAPSGKRWRVRTAVLVLALATAGVVVESEILVHAVEGVTASLGLSEVFLGLVVIPLIGNAAEHATAVVVARKGQMDLAFQIALGSSTQIALLVAPLLVFAGLAFGVSMNLVFPIFEVMALAVATGVIAIITLDGETHWFEGAQLLAVYGLFVAAAYFI